jgi:hypothetical protein
MQFGRRSDNYAPTVVASRSMDPPDLAMEDKGWVCNADPSHFLDLAPGSRRTEGAFRTTSVIHA